jgi:putative membrane protein
MKYALRRISSSEDSPDVDGLADGNAEICAVRSARSFVTAALRGFLALVARRRLGRLLVFFVMLGPAGSADGCFLSWAVFVFFGTDQYGLSVRLSLIGRLASAFSPFFTRSVKLGTDMAGIRQFVVRWAATTVAVMVASSVIHGIRYDTVAALIGASLLLGILNAFVRPILLILSAPLILLTLGFFILVLNGLLLLLVPSVIVGFHVGSFWSAFWGAIVISIVSWLLSAFFRGSDGRVHVLTHHTEIRRVRGRVLDDEERP